MASAKVLEMTIGIPDVSISIWYNDANLRVTNVEWNVPVPGVSIRARIWDDGQLVYDRTVGQGSGGESVPGNYRVEQVTMEGDTFYDLPANLTWQFNIETIG